MCCGLIFSQIFMNGVDEGAHLELLMSFGKDQRHLVNVRGSVGQGQSVRHPCVG